MTELFREVKKLGAASDFCSNDYLGLSKNLDLRQQLIDFLGTTSYLSSSASRLIAGHHHLHEEAEGFLSGYFTSESGLLFNSGYSANSGVLSTLTKNAVVYSDERNHASLIDGMRLSRADCKIFRHNDLLHLEELLQENTSGRPRFIVTESLFSMDGDFSPLLELQTLARKCDAILIVDEAHANGIFGPRGEGRIAELGMSREGIISIHTFGKAYAAFGAFVACSQKVRNLLVNTCRDFIYTTALPPHMVFQIMASVRHVADNPSLRQKLEKNCAQFGTLTGLPSASQIMPVILKSNERVLRAEKILLTKGFQVSAIRSPSVSLGAERLRICLHADPTLVEIETLASYVTELVCPQ